jgi:hypothetical protein
VTARAFPEPEDTTLRTFTEPDTLRDVLLAAQITKQLGYVPELRLDDRASSIELYVKDIPAMIGRLRASLAESRKQ